MKQLDHIGIAVSDLKKAKDTYQRLIGVPAYKEEVVRGAGVRVAFFQAGGVKIELLSPLSDDTVLARFLKKKGEGLHHLAFRVDHLEEACQDMQAQGFGAINSEPQAGAEKKKVCFFHPQNTHKVLIELCQFNT